ncbi:hypothetical protein BDR05DRAFT_1055227 [Suillus weaverae]|nr:hypothetical protein BDR05DRAFT_1055227 [Suillus weaverae]
MTEAILDEDDLLQTCKSQNTRLVDYFQSVEALLWTTPSWETVLDKSHEVPKLEDGDTVMASHFAKINTVFLTKKPAERCAPPSSNPNHLRLLRHVETLSIVDLLVCIVQLDEVPGDAIVLDWLPSENLTGRLVELFSPAYVGDMHTVVLELIRGILSMATASPALRLTDASGAGTAREVRMFTYAMVASEVPQIRFEVRNNAVSSERDKHAGGYKLHHEHIPRYKLNWGRLRKKSCPSANRSTGTNP